MSNTGNGLAQQLNLNGLQLIKGSDRTLKRYQVWRNMSTCLSDQNEPLILQTGQLLSVQLQNVRQKAVHSVCYASYATYS